MKDEKKYLFPSGGSHLLGLILSLGLLGVSIYDVIWGDVVILREGNVFVDALMLFMLLTFVSMLEGCMMIATKEYLFAYNLDKAMCVSLKNGDLKSAVSMARKLYGPIYDRNCEEHFSSRPRSPLTRKMFYATAVAMLMMSLVSPCYNLFNAFCDGVWSLNLVAAWVLVLADCFLIVNRIFSRASIRKFWAWFLGDDNFRSILNFELSGGDLRHCPSFVVNNDERNLPADCIPGSNTNVPSRWKIVLIGVAVIAIVVMVLNARRGRNTQRPLIYTPQPLSSTVETKMLEAN